MSQASQPGSPPVATAAPPPQTAQSAQAPPGSAAAVATQQPAATTAPRTDTPRQLRLLTLAMLVGGVLIGLVGSLTLAYLAYAVNRAEADSAQLVRVQKIETNLLLADATATNAFLVGGLEPPAQRAAYDAALTDSTALIAEAARAQPADAAALAALNTQVISYAADVEQARANNRQGLPVGAQYLRTASADLRATALPLLDNLVTANSARAGDGMSVRIGYLVVGLTLLGLVGAVYVQLWVARRFRRRINLGLLLSSAVLLVAFVASALGVSALRSSVAEVRGGSFHNLNVAAAARIEAYDAKSNESLTLIARGSGAAFEQAWVMRAGQVRTNLGGMTDTRDINERWTAYADVHNQIRKLDDGGSWDAAVAKATGTGNDSANAAFGAFDQALAAHLETFSASTTDQLSARQPGLVIGSILILLAGLAAALLGRAGLAVRLREYR